MEEFNQYSFKEDPTPIEKKDMVLDLNLLKSYHVENKCLLEGVQITNNVVVVAGVSMNK